MYRKVLALLVLGMTIGAIPALALSPGQDVLVPAAARIVDPSWVTDLYVMNPGNATVSVEVFWLVRGQANPNPTSITFNLLPGQTEILDDVIFNNFMLSEGEGAFRVVASGAVVVNSRIYAVEDAKTYGQGFEGVPTWAATAAGESSSAVGLSDGSAFRSNVYAVAGPTGATVQLEVVDPSGTRIGNTINLALGTYQPYLRRVSDPDVMNTGTFANGSLRITVSAGSAVVGASKVDNTSGDPTTLESTASGGGGSPDGTYQFSVWDSYGPATGGYLVMASDVVDYFEGAYLNFDKGVIDPETGEPINGGISECTTLFPFWPDAPADVAEFATGFQFSFNYPGDVGFSGGDILYTVTFTMNGSSAFSGTLEAVGSNFSGLDAGCNGVFPTMDLFGGKSN
jgi:hypothetical protein